MWKTNYDFVTNTFHFLRNTGMMLFSQMRRKKKLYYHDASQRVWRKPLTALENKNLIPTVKFGKLSIMIRGSISDKGVGIIRTLDEIMIKEVYLDILKNELIAIIKKFGFIDPVNRNKFYRLRHLTFFFFATTAYFVNVNT